MILPFGYHTILLFKLMYCHYDSIWAVNVVKMISEGPDELSESD